MCHKVALPWIHTGALQEELAAALASTGIAGGLQVVVPPLGSIEYQVYHRGVRMQEVSLL